MEKAFYLVTCRNAFKRLQADQPEESALCERLLVAITQGGFGQDVIDDVRQVKERFLEYVFSTDGIDLPRTPQAFDEYFELEAVGDLIDLDEEL